MLVVTTMRYSCDGKGCYLENRWDPAMFDGLLPRDSSLINMDGWCEIGGQFLFVEYKRQNEELADGQFQALRRLASLPGCTVVVLREQEGDQYRMTNLSNKAVVRGSLDDIRWWVQAWGIEADRAAQTPLSRPMVEAHAA